MKLSRLYFLPLVLVALAAAACRPADEPDAPDPPRAAVAEIAAEAPAEAVEDECRLTMGWDPWEPYHYAGAGGRVQGLDVELMTAVAAGAGCELEFEQGNWASLLRLLQNGDVDLLVGATTTPEREQFARFSDAYRDESFRLFVRVEDVRQYSDQSLEDLMREGFRLGVTQGYIYGGNVGELQAHPSYRGQFIEAAVGELNFTHLLDYSIDGFLEDPFVAAAIQRRRGEAEAVEALDLEIASGPVHMMFSRQTVDAETVGAFDESLSHLRESGEYDEILGRYLQ